MNSRKSRNTRHRRAPNRARNVWHLDVPAFHPGIVPPRSFFRTDSLISGLEVAISRRDPLLFAALETPATAGETMRVSGSLVAENNYALELLLEFHLRNRKPFRLRLVVARNAEEYSQTVRAEAQNLSKLAPRLGGALPTPVKIGSLLLPDTPRRTASGRRIAAYSTTTIRPSHYLGIGGSGQFTVYEPKTRLLALDASDMIRRRILELCLRSYDSSTRSAMPPPDLERGTVRFAEQGDSHGNVVLTGCPFLWDRLDPVGLIHRLTGFDWKERRRHLRLLPADHDLLRDALVAAVGSETADQWVREYVSSLENGRYKPHHRFPLDAARALRDALTL